MKNSEELLIVYVKDPGVDRVKSRLGEQLGPKRATEIYRQLLHYTRSILHGLTQDIRISYAYSIASNDLWEGLEKTTQSDGDLGSRMQADFVRAFEQGYQKVCLIGSDCAEITERILKDAFTALDTQPAVFGPARDGGYYLVGLTTDLSDSSRIFENISWSTSKVMKETRKRLKELGVEAAYLPVLSDIDRADDLPLHLK